MTHNTPYNTIYYTAIPNTKFTGILEYHSGTKYHYKHGLRHRNHDLPSVEYKDGEKSWYQNGKFIKRKYIIKQ